jgi:hypothetical protein
MNSITHGPSSAYTGGQEATPTVSKAQVSDPTPQTVTTKGPDLTAQNLGQRSGDAIRSASTKVAPGPFALFKSMIKGSSSFARDMEAVKQASQAPKSSSTAPTTQPKSGFGLKATKFVSQLMVTRGAISDMAKHLSQMATGDSSTMEGETKLTGSAGLNAKVASAGVSGELKAATTIKVDCHGGPFVVTISTHGGGKLGASASLGTEVMGIAKGKALGIETRVFACESPEAAAEIIQAFHSGESLDIQGVTPMLDDRNAKMETTSTKQTVLVKGSEKATACTGLLGKIRQQFDSRTEQTMDVSETKAESDGNTMVTRTFSLASEKPLSALSGLKKAVTLGALTETKIATKVELEVTTVSDIDESAMKGDLTLQFDSEKVEAMGKSFQAFGIVVDKETNRMMTLLESANEKDPGTFDVGPEAREAIRIAVHDACATIVEAGKSLQGKDAGTLDAKLGGDVGGAELAVGLSLKFGSIITIKLPFQMPENPQSGGPKLKLDVAGAEIGVTTQDGHALSASVGASAVVAEVSLAASSGRTSGTYVRVKVGLEADIQIDGLSLEAFGIKVPDVIAKGDVAPNAANGQPTVDFDWDDL